MQKFVAVCFISVFSLFFIRNEVNGQQSVQIQGRVFDIETLLPLQNATLVIAGTSIGVATNSEGAFKLNIPKLYSDSLIRITYVGYKPAYISAKEGVLRIQTIYLEPLDIILEEVVIKARKRRAEEIISEAIWSIGENYEMKANMLKCFYREITYINNDEVITTEALLDVYKTAYLGIREEDQVKVSKVRQVGGSPESGFGFEGGAYYRISDDVIANRPGFLIKENLQYYDFNTSRILGRGDEAIIVISFKPDRGAINSVQDISLGRTWDTYANSLLMYSGEIFVHEKDHAIVKVDYWLDKDKLKFAEKQYLTKVPDESIIALMDVRFTAEYRKQKNRYYLNFTNGQIRFRISNEDLGISQDYKVYNELLTVDRTEYGAQQFSAREVTGTEDLVPDYQDSYKADFWENENIVQAYSRLNRLGSKDIAGALFEDRLSKGLNKLRINKPLERIFLHVDRNRYISGDNIYFKAYVTEEATGIPSFLSKTFYVSLSDSIGNILKESRFGLKSGRGHGNLTIPSDLKQGVYKLYSYPSFSQNFDPDNCFVQSIIIEDEISFVEGIDNENQQKINSDTDIKDTDIQFLPEGGHLIPGYLNNIAFCAVTSQGAPVELTLQVRDNNENVIDTISTNGAGLGSFKITPKKEFSYYARVVEPLGYNHLKFNLPPTSSNGVGMEVVTNQVDNLTVRLHSSSKLAEQLRIVLIKDSEILCSVDKEIRGSCLADLPFHNLSTGIATITVFRREEPIAERLVFLDAEQRLNIQSSLEYGAYKVRDKMQLKIKVTDQSGYPVKAFLSASVVDSINCISDKFSVPDIRYVFWLRSNLKKSTPIHIPMMVLNRIGIGDSNLIEDLDLLLLSYGWRKYSIKKLLSTVGETNKTQLINYDYISGRIRALKKRSKRLAVKELQVFEPKSFYHSTVYTDRSGSFSFSPMSFLYDKELLWNFTERKQGARWEISIDTVVNYEFRYSLRTIKSMDLALKLDNIPVEIDESFDPLIFMRYIKIPEVTVRTQQIDRSEQRTRLVGSINNLGNLKSGSFEDFKHLPDLESIIRSIQPPSRIIRTHPSELSPVFWIFFRTQNQYGLSKTIPRALFVVNDVPIDSAGGGQEVQYMDPGMIKSVSIISGPQAFAFFGAKALGGAIMIYTREPGDEYIRLREKDPGIVTTAPLCNTIKEFYKPNYEDADIDLDKADYRLSFHWDPELVTDINGEAIIEYFNAGYNSYVTGVIQGMSLNGEPVHHRFNYRVIKE